MKDEKKKRPIASPIDEDAIREVVDDAHEPEIAPETASKDELLLMANQRLALHMERHNYDLAAIWSVIVALIQKS